MSRQPRYWFPAKRYGWGWGFPTTWKGWAVMGVYVALVALGAFYVSASTRPALFAAYVIALSALLVAVCWIKGEPPRWRWGEREGP